MSGFGISVPYNADDFSSADSAKLKGPCEWCGVMGSVFWHRFSYGCDSVGNGGRPFVICDQCAFDLSKFVRSKQKKDEVHIGTMKGVSE